MVINPKIAIREKWVMFPDTFSEEFINKCIQPNGIDFTLDALHMVDTYAPAFISETSREFKKTTPVFSTQMGDGRNMYTLYQNVCYDFVSNIKVNIPSGVMAKLEVRSTLNRVGVGLTSGVYDTGFSGNIAGHLRPFAGQVYIEPGTRIGQIVFYTAVESSSYDGIYNNQTDYWLNAVGLKVEEKNEDSN